MTTLWNYIFLVSSFKCAADQGEHPQPDPASNWEGDAASDAWAADLRLLGRVADMRGQIHACEAVSCSLWALARHWHHPRVRPFVRAGPAPCAEQAEGCTKLCLRAAGCADDHRAVGPETCRTAQSAHSRLDSCAARLYGQ